MRTQLKNLAVQDPRNCLALVEKLKSEIFERLEIAKNEDDKSDYVDTLESSFREFFLYLFEHNEISTEEYDGSKIMNQAVKVLRTHFSNKKWISEERHAALLSGSCQFFAKKLFDDANKELTERYQVELQTHDEKHAAEVLQLKKQLDLPKDLLEMQAKFIKVVDNFDKLAKRAEALQSELDFCKANKPPLPPGDPDDPPELPPGPPPEDENKSNAPIAPPMPGAPFAPPIPGAPPAPPMPGAPFAPPIPGAPPAPPMPGAPFAPPIPGAPPTPGGPPAPPPPSSPSAPNAPGKNGAKAKSQVEAPKKEKPPPSTITIEGKEVVIDVNKLILQKCTEVELKGLEVKIKSDNLKVWDLLLQRETFEGCLSAIHSDVLQSDALSFVENIFDGRVPGCNFIGASAWDQMKFRNDANLSPSENKALDEATALMRNSKIGENIEQCLLKHPVIQAAATEFNKTYIQKAVASKQEKPKTVKQIVRLEILPHQRAILDAIKVQDFRDLDFSNILQHYKRLMNNFTRNIKQKVRQNKSELDTWATQTELVKIKFATELAKRTGIFKNEKQKAETDRAEFNKIYNNLPTMLFDVENLPSPPPIKPDFSNIEWDHFTIPAKHVDFYIDQKVLQKGKTTQINQRFYVLTHDELQCIVDICKIWNILLIKSLRDYFHQFLPHVSKTMDEVKEANIIVSPFADKTIPLQKGMWKTLLIWFQFTELKNLRDPEEKVAAPQSLLKDSLKSKQKKPEDGSDFKLGWYLPIADIISEACT